MLGVNITNGNLGTTSEYDGSFSIFLEPGNSILEFTYVGYERQLVNLDTLSSENLIVYLGEANTFLETAIVTGSRYEKNISDSPVSISILKPHLISSTNTQQFDKILDKIPGVQMINGQVNIRGGSGFSYGAGSRVLLLVDDMPALQGDAGRPTWGDIPVENISQVEIVKGASSALYGSAALNGIINIRTGYALAEPETRISTSYEYTMAPKDPSKKWWGSENGQISHPRAIASSLLHKQKFGKLDFVFHAHHLDSDTYLENGYNNRLRLSTNLRYRFNERLSASLNTMFNTGESADFFLWKNGGGGALEPLAGSFSVSSHTRYYIDPSVTYYDKSNNRHKVLGRYYYIDNENNMNQSNSSKNYYGEYQFLTDFERINAKFTCGASYNGIASDSELFQDTLTTSDNYALYAQIEKELIENVSLTFGWRLESNKLVGPAIVDGIEFPSKESSETKSVLRAGVNMGLSDYTFLRASWGQGYRFPTITEKYIRTTFSNLSIYPNPDLRSEFGWSAEIGIKQGFRLFGYEGFLDIAPFWSKYEDMTEFTFVTVNGNQGFQSRNVGNTDIKGIEFNVGGRSTLFSIPINIIGGYTYIDPKYDNFEGILQESSSVDYNILKYRTKHNWKVDIEAEITEGIRFGSSINRTSHMEAVDGILESFGGIGPYSCLLYTSPSPRDA